MHVAEVPIPEPKPVLDKFTLGQAYELSHDLFERGLEAIAYEDWEDASNHLEIAGLYAAFTRERGLLSKIENAYLQNPHVDRDPMVYVSNVSQADYDKWRITVPVDQEGGSVKMEYVQLPNWW